jgi:hypothetical protein
MTLLEHEQRRSRHARRKHHKQVKREWQKSTLDAPLDMSHPNQVLTFREWCELSRFSERTGRRVLRSGNGPTVTQLSEKRIGVTVGNNAAWQASRARGS